MDTIFMNSKNNKSSDSYRLLLNLTDKITLKKEVTKMLLHQILAYIIDGKI